MMEELSHEAFLQQYILNRCRGAERQDMNGFTIVQDAQRAWEEIQAIIGKADHLTSDAPNVQSPSKPKTEVMYGIGIEDPPGSFSMSHGPTPSFDEMLRVRMNDMRAVIVKFLPGETERVVSRWSMSLCGWGNP